MADGRISPAWPAETRTSLADGKTLGSRQKPRLSDCVNEGKAKAAVVVLHFYCVDASAAFPEKQPLRVQGKTAKPSHS